MAVQDPGNGGARAVGQVGHDDPRDRGIGELVKDLAGQTSTLVRQEIKLAQAEVTQKGKLAGKGAGMLAGAGVTALLGLGALTALLIIAARQLPAAVARRADRDAAVVRRRRRTGPVGQEGAAGGDAARTPDR